MKLPWPTRHTPIARIGNLHPLSVHLHTPDSSLQRQSVEQFIHSRFATHYGADVRQFMPFLLEMRGNEGKIHGAAGIRRASQPLFLERYLDTPIEQLIANSCDLPVIRGNIVEIGNLAALGAASARFLIIALTRLLAELDYHWVAFTGTPTLINSFGRLNLDLIPLMPADRQRMGHELAGWGSYYDCNPWVMAIDARQAHLRLQQQNLYESSRYQSMASQQEARNASCC